MIEINGWVLAVGILGVAITMFRWGFRLGCEATFIYIAEHSKQIHQQMAVKALKGE